MRHLNLSSLLVPVARSIVMPIESQAQVTGDLGSELSQPCRNYYVCGGLVFNIFGVHIMQQYCQRLFLSFSRDFTQSSTHPPTHQI